jgi:hypothetical protein
MEANLAEKLRTISSFRSKFLDEAISYLPLAAEHSATFHSLVIFTTVTILIAIYSELRALTLFSMHPTCMTIGCLLFLSEGIVAFRNRSLVETLSPIMQNNKKTKVIHTLYLNRHLNFNDLLIQAFFTLTRSIEICTTQCRQ